MRACKKGLTPGYRFLLPLKAITDKCSQVHFFGGAHTHRDERAEGCTPSPLSSPSQLLLPGEAQPAQVTSHPTSGILCSQGSHPALQVAPSEGRCCRVVGETANAFFAKWL